MTSFMVPAVGGRAAVLAGVLVAGSGSGFSSDLALTIVGIIGNALAFSLIFVPLWTFVKPIVNAQSVGNRTVYGHVVMMLSGAAWGLYALPDWPKTRYSVAINGICFVLQLVYVMVFIRHADGMTRWTAVVLLLVALIVTGALTWMVVVKVMLRGEWEISFIAPIASTISCVGYVAVGLDIVAVVRSEDVANMDPLLEVLLNMLNASAWVYFGYLSTPIDHYIGAPNVIGVLFLAVQLGVYVKHFRADHEPEHEEPEVAAADPDDFGTDLGLMFATPSPSSGSDIEVVIAAPA
ncbi:hypothetical protein ACQ4PT_040344 [Festuca glaucescens]